MSYYNIIHIQQHIISQIKLAVKQWLMQVNISSHEQQTVGCFNNLPWLSDGLILLPRCM